MIHDLIVETWDDDVLAWHVTDMGVGRLVMDPESGQPFEDDAGCLTVRLKNVENPEQIARALQRRVLGLRVVEVVNRS